MKYNIKSDAKVLVVGDLMLDHYINGACSRISPEAPVQVVEVQNEVYTLGGAGNVIKNLKAFGCTAGIISICGADEKANLITEHIEATGANIFHVLKDDKRCTTVKSRVLVSNHQLIRLDKEDTSVIGNDLADKLLEKLRAIIAGYDIVLVSDYNKGLLSKYFLREIFALCRSVGVKTVVDPKGTEYSKYYGANLIKPNKKEAIIATGINIIDKESLRCACIKIKELTNCDDVVITMSEEGMAMFANNELDVISTRALAVIDVTGAGDTVLSAIGLALASGNTLHQACNFANRAAAVVVSKVGSATATLDEII